MGGGVITSGLKQKQEKAAPRKGERVFNGEGFL